MRYQDGVFGEDKIWLLLENKDNRASYDFFLFEGSLDKMDRTF